MILFRSCSYFCHSFRQINASIINLPPKWNNDTTIFFYTNNKIMIILHPDPLNIYRWSSPKSSLIFILMEGEWGLSVFQLSNNEFPRFNLPVLENLMLYWIFSHWPDLLHLYHGCICPKKQWPRLLLWSALAWMLCSQFPRTLPWVRIQSCSWT